MPKSIRSIALITFTSLLISLHATAQTPDQARIKELEQENDALRQELAVLRLEVSQLKRELKEHQPANPNQESDSADHTDETDQRGDKKTDQDKPKTMRSADEIYRLIPKEIRPKRDGWGIVETKTVKSWLTTSIVGKRFESRKEIKSVYINYDPIKSIWKVKIAFEDEKMSYMGWDMKEKFSPVELQGDKSFAEMARKKYHAGETIHVSGLIVGIGWDFITRHGVAAEANWHPSYCQLRLDDVKLK